VTRPARPNAARPNAHRPTPMPKRFAILAVVAALLLSATGVSLARPSRQSQEPRLLVFSKTAGFRHSSI